MPEYCNHCDRPLKEKQIVWLEFDNTLGTYHQPGEVPEEDSLGLYPFGKTCAKEALKIPASYHPLRKGE